MNDARHTFRWSPRLDHEIVFHLVEARDVDAVSLLRCTLAGYLPRDLAQPLLWFDIATRDWDPPSREFHDLIASIAERLPEAWAAVSRRDEPGAERDLALIRAALWMLREDEAVAHLSRPDRCRKADLRAISEAVGFDWRAHDMGVWTNDDVADEGMPADGLVADLGFFWLEAKTDAALARGTA